jgi:hypothetical protein
LAGLFWAIEAVLLGCLLVLRSGAPGSGWNRVCLAFGAGAGLGIGLTSTLYFLFRGVPAAAIAIEAALILWAGWGYFRVPHAAKPPAKERGSWHAWLAGAGLAVSLALAATAAAQAFDANPHGWWDAWAIWNLRARFLAANGTLAARAWSNMLGPGPHNGLGGVHPEYPLLLSSFVGRCWRLGNSLSPLVPAATSFVFFLALVALAAGGIGRLRGSALGLLAGLTIASTPALLHQASIQCADVPLACYMLGAVMLALVDRPVLSGLFAGFAVSTKDEGWFFLLLFAAATLLFRRRGMRAFAAGALGPVLIAAYFKFALSRGNPSLLSASLPGIGARLADPARYLTVLRAFGQQAASMGVGWYHPVLPLIALAICLRWTREYRSQAIYCGAIAVGMLLVYFGTFIATANDLRWQLDTSLDRLLVQVWPMIVVAAFLAVGQD